MRDYKIIFFGFFFLIHQSFAAAPSDIEKIRQILAPLGKKVSLSVRAADGKEILGVNSNQDFSPASVIKMVSTGCALRQLTPQYQFETWFGIRGSIRDKKLVGDLVIEGSGDSSFVIENLKEALERLHVLYGIDEIQGSIIFDSSYLGVQSLEISDEFAGDEVRAFNAPITANPLNFNSFSVAIAAVDTKTFVEILPKDSMEATIKNEVKVSDSVAVQIDQPKREIIFAKGKMSSSAEPKFFYRSVPDPYAMYAQLIRRVWTELGGKWPKPQYKVETKQVSYQRLFAMRSPALSKMLMDINKLSTNMGAEMVALAAGAKEFGLPASFEKSKKMISQCWQEMGLPPQRFKIYNASGLSRDTKIQTADLTSFLVALKDESFWPEYLSSLSVLGRDGTTKKRLLDLVAQARLKTGSIQGVKTVAGYLFPKKKTPLVIALFSEGLDPKINWVNIEDQIIRILLES